MKTHEVAKVLTSLAQVLRSGPNVELDQIAYERPVRGKPNPSDIPIALSALVSLSQFDKSHWRAVIEEYGLPVQVRPAESTRDIVGKILRALERDPEARNRLTQAVQRSKSSVSPELMNALNSLLKIDASTGT
jgi:hypothetical protein